MCLASPGKVIKIKKDWAEVKIADHSRKINISLLKNIKAGDYLLAHGEMAINKVSRAEAEKIIEFVSGRKTENKFYDKKG